jgi:hypothetical protein
LDRDKDIVYQGDNKILASQIADQLTCLGLLALSGEFRQIKGRIRMDRAVLVVVEANGFK